MANTDGESVQSGSWLERANRVRAELGLRPLTERQVDHDRSLADPSGLRLAALIDVCATMRLTEMLFTASWSTLHQASAAGPLPVQPVRISRGAPRFWPEADAFPAVDELMPDGWMFAIKAAVADGVAHAPNLNALRNVLAELFERVQLVKGDDLSPLSTYAGDGMAPLDDLSAGEGLWLVPILRGDALDDECEPSPVELPVRASTDAKP